MMLLGFNGLGSIDTSCTDLSPDSMSVGDACTLPDGSNIGVWNGVKLAAGDGSSNIDGINAAALVAGNSSWGGKVAGGAGGNNTSTGSSPSGGSAGGQTAWWSSALTALTKGVVQGSGGPTIVPCISPGVPAGCVVLPVVTPPWYTTPIGMLGIALTIGVGYVVLKK